MEFQYTYAAKMAQLYSLLEDKLSKDIFWNRLRFDCEPTVECEAELYALNDQVSREEIWFHREIGDVSKKIGGSGKKLFLYGTSILGRTVGQWILESGGDFFAYCARNHEKYVDGVLGKPVYSPQYVFDHPEECFVIIPGLDVAEEIYELLMEHHFPKEQIEFWFRPSTRKKLLAQSYFKFPELFFKGTAFVDAGCYDCDTSFRFAEWCGRDYSKIFAFEPDPKNYEKCRDIIADSELRMELHPLGLSDHTGILRFASKGSEGSYIMDTEDSKKNDSFNIVTGKDVKEEITIQVAALDDIVNNTTIGLIKMDIEGAELDALRGAKRTILRDKPQLAICVYHRCGDVLAIMDYLHSLVPQYRFWLRNYSAFGSDTVLYAAL